MMKKIWQEYSAKFLTITPREQYLVFLTGLIGIVFIFFTLAIDEKLIAIEKLTKQINQTTTKNKSTKTSIQILEQSLANDPNIAIEKQIAQYEKKLSTVDDELMLLTSDLINPIQMRYALIDLLKMEKTVALLSFEIIEAQALKLPQQESAETDKSDDSEDSTQSKQSLTLYKHGLKLKLKGDYFALRDYLKQLEKLDWKFFWQTFDYKLIQYPNSELHIEMYSLSTKKEFIGV